MLLLLACATPPATSPLSTYHGSLTVTEAAPVDFCARWDHITGSLTLDGLAETDAFACLVEVGGTLTIEGDVATDLAGLGAVRTAGGLHLSMPGDDLRGLDGLEQVAGDVEIDGDVESLVGLGALRQVVGSLSIHDVPRLSTLDGLDSLWIVNGRVGIEDNPALVTVDGLDGLHFVDTLGVSDSPIESLAALDGLEVETLVGLHDLPALTSLPTLGTWSRGVYLRSLGILDLRGMEPVESLDTLSITGMDQLSSLHGLENLHVVEGELMLQQLPALTSLDGLGTLSARYVYITETAITTMEPMRLRGSEHVEIWDVPDLADLAAFTGATEIGSLALSDLPSLVAPTGLEAVTAAEAVGVWLCPGLSDLSPLAALTQVGALDLWDTGVTSLGALTALTALDSLRLIENPALTQIDLPGDLGALNGELWINNNPQLQWIESLRTIDAVDGDVFITLNPQLLDADAYAVIDAIGADDIDGSIHVGDNAP